MVVGKLESIRQTPYYGMAICMTVQRLISEFGKRIRSVDRQSVFGISGGQSGEVKSHKPSQENLAKLSQPR